MKKKKKNSFNNNKTCSLIILRKILRFREMNEKMYSIFVHFNIRNSKHNIFVLVIFKIFIRYELNGKTIYFD